MAATALQRLQRVYDNYCQILVMVTELIATGAASPGSQPPAPTQANIDALVLLADGSGIVRPHTTYSVDGESYDWTGYQEFITNQLLVIEKAMQRASGPFQIRSRGIT